MRMTRQQAQDLGETFKADKLAGILHNYAMVVCPTCPDVVFVLHTRAPASPNNASAVQTHEINTVKELAAHYRSDHPGVTSLRDPISGKDISGDVPAILESEHSSGWKRS